MKLIHKVEESAVYEYGKCQYTSSSSSAQSNSCI